MGGKIHISCDITERTEWLKRERPIYLRDDVKELLVEVGVLIYKKLHLLTSWWQFKPSGGVKLIDCYEIKG